MTSEIPFTPVHLCAGRDVLGHWPDLAAAVVDRGLDQLPEISQRLGWVDREEALRDAGFRLSFLAQALYLNSQTLFTDHVAWANIMLGRRKVPPSDLALHLESLAEVLVNRLPAASGALAAEFVRTSVRAMPQMSDDLPSFLTDDARLSPLAGHYLAALLRGEREAATRKVLDAVEAGLPVRDVYLDILQPVQRELGRLWQTNRISIAEEQYCTAATQLVMSHLYPRIFASRRNGRSMVATCVAGDLHEIGVRMVADFFEMDGWNTYYLGADTPDAGVIDALIDCRAHLLAISATMTYHLEAVRKLIQAVRANPDCRAIGILVGGYPFNQSPDLWREIGADGHASDAQAAVALGHLIVR